MSLTAKDGDKALFDELCDAAQDKSTNQVEGTLSIHHTESKAFYKSIGANDHVLNILENGLKLPLATMPPPYHEDNNASAYTHASFLHKKVMSWAKAGYC